MAQITWLIDGSNTNHDYQLTALANLLINPGVISGLVVSLNSVASGFGFIKCTRTNGQEIIVHYVNTAAFTIDTSGTKKVWIWLDQSDIDNGSWNALDGTGIATIQTWASYPAGNYIPLASITGGTITDERVLITKKAILGKGYWTWKTKYLDPATWDEVLKNTSAAWSVGSTDLVLVRDASTGDEKRAPYSSILSDIGNMSTVNVHLPAGEDIAAWKMTYQEDACSTYLLMTAIAKVTVESMGNTAGNTRKSWRIIGNWVAMTTMKLAIDKVGSPADNFEVRIETDSGWSPSGTAVTNGTWSVTGGSLAWTVADVTITFAGSVTLTPGVVYHIVLRRSAWVDVANYYRIYHLTKNVRGFTTNTHNGTVWGSPATNKQLYMTCTGAYQSIACMTSASFIEQTYFTGIVNAAFLTWAVATIQKIGPSRALSGLSKNTGYFLSNTAGALSTTPGTISRQVGWSDDRTDAIHIIPQEHNPTFSESNNVVYTTFFTGPSWLWKADFACQLFITLNVSGSSSLQLFKNWTAIRNLAWWWSATTDTVVVAPGDIIFAASNTANAAVQILTKLQPHWRQLTT